MKELKEYIDLARTELHKKEADLKKNGKYHLIIPTIRMYLLEERQFLLNLALESKIKTNRIQEINRRLNSEL